METDDELKPQTDAEWIAALQQGDENAFTALVQQYHAQMIRVALAFVSNPAIAEEVVQETWIGVLRGLGRFEARATLKTWIFSILINKAKTIAKREVRYSQNIEYEEGASTAASVSAVRFHPPNHETSAGHWALKPQDWGNLPEEKMLSQETLSVIQSAINDLAPNHREVLVLRDVEGWTSSEVCNVLEISETNQRVLLHRARSKVRAVLEDYLRETGE